jgi:hypothetical protein
VEREKYTTESKIERIKRKPLRDEADNIYRKRERERDRERESGEHSEKGCWLALYLIPRPLLWQRLLPSRGRRIRIRSARVLIRCRRRCRRQRSRLLFFLRWRTLSCLLRAFRFH